MPGRVSQKSSFLKRVCGKLNNSSFWKWNPIKKKKKKLGLYLKVEGMTTTKIILKQQFVYKKSQNFMLILHVTNVFFITTVLGIFFKIHFSHFKSPDADTGGALEVSP